MGQTSGERPPIDPAASLLEKGIAYRQAGESVDAIKCYGEALELTDSLTTAEGLHTRALILLNQSNIVEDETNYKVAIELTEKAIDIWRKLVDQGVVRVNDELANALQNQANKLVKFGNLNAARSAAEQSLAIYEQLVTKEDRADLAVAMGRLLGAMSIIARKLGQPERALPLLERSIEVFNRAWSPRERDQLRAVQETWKADAADLRALLSVRPNEFKQWLSKAEGIAADAKRLALAGDTFHASESTDGALEIYVRLGKVEDKPEFRERAAQLNVAKGMWAMHSGRFWAAATAFQTAIDQYTQLLNDQRAVDLIEPWARAHLAFAAFHEFQGDDNAAQGIISDMKDRLRLLDPGALEKWSSEADRVLSELRARYEGA